MTPLRILLTAALIGLNSASSEQPEHQIRHHKLRRRSFYSTGWSGQQLRPEPHIWKPAIYQLTRPYYIPIFGAPGQVPIYYPPQPLLLNPGAPKENPPPVYKGPKYLPPSTDGITDRFNGDDEDDDAPVWADSPAGRPLNSQTVHGAAQSSATNHLSAAEAGKEERPPRPRPQRPIAAAATPPATSQLPPRPSNCVWAIVACCSAESTTVPASCFEERGCSGPFWDASPCDSEFAKQAVEAALNYYSMQAR